jgi:putative SOS response-associated peptidase YedK
MCNLYTLEKGPDAIRKIFEAAQIPLTFPEGIPNFEPRDVRITDRAPIVRFNRDSGAAELVERRWSWPAPGGKPVFNMRSDGRECGRDRCLVVADGFYEWQKTRDEKQPFYIRLKSGGPFAFAGLYDVWESPDETVTSCTIITTEPNELMSSIHNRMPVILGREESDLWLQEGERDPDALLALLKPYPAELMEAYAVSKSVNSPRFNGPNCIKPTE